MGYMVLNGLFWFYLKAENQGPRLLEKVDVETYAS